MSGPCATKHRIIIITIIGSGECFFDILNHHLCLSCNVFLALAFQLHMMFHSGLQAARSVPDRTRQSCSCVHLGEAMRYAPQFEWPTWASHTVGVMPLLRTMRGFVAMTARVLLIFSRRRIICIGSLSLLSKHTRCCPMTLPHFNRRKSLLRIRLKARIPRARACL